MGDIDQKISPLFFSQYSAKIFPCVGCRMLGNLFGCAFHYNIPSPASPFRSDIDNIICTLNKIHIVLNSNSRIALINKFLENFNKLFYIFKKNKRFFHGHFKYFKNTFLFIFDFKRLFLKTFSTTDVARNINSRQKVHFNCNSSIPLTRFTSPPFYVKGKPTRTPPADPCLFAFRKKLADKGEHTSVGCRI